MTCVFTYPVLRIVGDYILKFFEREISILQCSKEGSTIYRPKNAKKLKAAVYVYIME